MSYHVEYDGGTVVKQTVVNSRHAGLIAVLISIAVLFCTARMIGTERIRTFLIPGDPEVTSSAFQTMIGSLRDGSSLQDAFTTFCVEILENAEMEGK